MFVFSQIAHFTSLGGKDIKTKTHKILKTVFSDVLAATFSFYGKRGKEAFSELKINKAIIRKYLLKILLVYILEHV